MFQIIQRKEMSVQAIELFTLEIKSAAQGMKWITNYLIAWIFKICMRMHFIIIQSVY